MNVQLDHVTGGIQEFDDELSHLLGRQVSGPREDRGQGEEDGSCTFVAADQCSEEACGDVRGHLTLTVVALGGEVEVLAVAARDLDPLSAFNGVSDPFGVL